MPNGRGLVRKKEYVLTKKPIKVNEKIREVLENNSSFVFLLQKNTDEMKRQLITETVVGLALFLCPKIR